MRLRFWLGYEVGVNDAGTANSQVPGEHSGTLKWNGSPP